MNSRTEWTGVGLTVFSLLIVMVEPVFGWGLWVTAHYRISNLISSMVFLEALHVPITYIGVWYLEDRSGWVRRHSVSQRRRLSMELFLRIVITFVVFMFFLDYGYASSFFGGHPLTKTVPSLLVAIGSIAIIVMTLHHRVLQTQGLSLAYSHAHTNASWVHREKNGFKVLLGSLFILIFGRAIFALGFMNESGYRLLSHVALAISFAAVAYLVLLVFRVARAQSRERFLENVNYFKASQVSRSMLYPLAFLSPIATLLMEGVHGFEYVMLWKKMARPLPSRNLPLIFFFIVFFYGLSFTGTIWMLTHEHVTPIQGRLFLVLFAAANAITFGHFFLDGKLFEMKNPISRETVGALLVPATIPDRR